MNIVILGKYTVRELTALSLEDLLAFHEGKYEVEFSDGIELMSNRSLIYNRCYWELFIDYPLVPICKKHTAIKGFTSDIHLKLGDIIFHTLRPYFTEHNEAWRYARNFYKVTNTIYNLVATKLSSFVVTTSIYDLKDIYDDPHIKKAKDDYSEYVNSPDYNTTDVEGKIKHVHNVIENVMYDDGSVMRSSGIKHLCEANVLSHGQLKQLIGPRGFVHDIDSWVFKHPINVGYAEGLTTLYDSVVESRSASRALINNTAPLELSEYFNREMQLLTCTTHSVVGECCTGYQTIKYIVRDDDLRLLKGKNYMKDGIPVMIWDSIDDIVGETIEIRAITGCGNVDSQTVCKCCLGYSASIIPGAPDSKYFKGVGPVPQGTNVGYAICTSLCAIISQLLLSTKHYEASKAAMKLELSASSSRWLRMLSKDLGKVYLTNKAAKSNPVIRIPIEDVSQLTNILSIDVDELPPSRITSCLNMSFAGTDRDGNVSEIFDNVNLSISGVGCSLTSDVLKYLKREGWTNTRKYIEFQLVDWDYRVPILATPNVGDNVLLFLNEIKLFLMPNKNSTSKITDYRTPSAAISELIHLLQKRIKINMIQAEVFIRSCMTVDAAAGNYNLPNAGQQFNFTDAKRIIKYRNLGGMLAYQEQMDVILNPEWYVERTRPKHMLDDIINPDY